MTVLRNSIAATKPGGWPPEGGVTAPSSRGSEGNRHRLLSRLQMGFILSACLLCASSLVMAQGRGGRGVVPGAGQAVVSPTSGASFDAAQVARGEKAFGAQCASCHGANARGGKGKTEIDLLRSPMVLDDLGGREIGEFLKYGRPEKKMPKFDIAQDVVADMAAFLHRQIVAARSAERISG